MEVHSGKKAVARPYIFLVFESAPDLLY